MIVCYPQLATGAMAQFPLSKRLAHRTVMNRLPDGSTFRLADPDAGSRRWELDYRGLSGPERTALNAFFQDREGRLRTFLFLDPFGNLLAWSEDPGQVVWSKDGLLLVQSAGAVLTLTNAAQAAQQLRQSVAVPGWYTYCFSARVKSLTNTGVKLFLQNADGQIAASFIAGSAWEQISCSGAIRGSSEDITCGLEIAPGAVVEVREMQLQAQPSASAYRRTTDRTGAMPETRFDEDSLSFRAEGMDDHSTTVRLVSR